jgi:hypothetical protein
MGFIVIASFLADAQARKFLCQSLTVPTKKRKQTPDPDRIFEKKIGTGGGFVFGSTLRLRPISRTVLRG